MNCDSNVYMDWVSTVISETDLTFKVKRQTDFAFGVFIFDFLNKLNYIS